MRLLTASLLGLAATGSLFAGGAVHAVVSAVPEPGTFVLVATAAGAVLLLTKRGRKQQ